MADEKLSAMTDSGPVVSGDIFYLVRGTSFFKTSIDEIETFVDTSIIGAANGILKANGAGVVSAATVGTDYATGASTNVFTNKTFDTAATGNVFKINGTAISAITGTGSVVLATSPTIATPVIFSAPTTNGLVTSTSGGVAQTTAATLSTNGNTLTLAGGSSIVDNGSGQLTVNGIASNLVLASAGGSQIQNLIGGSKVGGFSANGFFTGNVNPSSASSFTLQINATTNAGTASPTTNYGALIQTTGTQTSVADFYGLIVNDTGTFGSGTHYLLDARLSGTSKFHVDSNGSALFNGNIQSATGSFLASNGSAPSPSISLTNFNTTGLYAANPGIGFSVAGGSVGSWTSVALQSNGGITANQGLTGGNSAFSYGAPVANGYTVMGSPAQTYTITGTTGIANFQASYFGVPTFTNVSANTITNLATVTIAGAPAVAGSQLGTNKYALLVLAGGVIFNGGFTAAGGMSNASGSGTAPSYTFTSFNNTGWYAANPGIGASVAGASVGTWTATGLTVIGSLTIASSTMLATTTAFTNNAGAQAATMTNGPTAGNPTKWIPINDNGTTRNIPAW